MHSTSNISVMTVLDITTGFTHGVHQCLYRQYAQLNGTKH